MNKDDLPDAVVAALTALGGNGTIPEVARQIWIANENLLRDAGDLFYTWQYDMRWAAQELRDGGQLVIGPRRNRQTTWQLV